MCVATRPELRSFQGSVIRNFFAAYKHVRRYDRRHDRDARLRGRVFQHTVRVGRPDMLLRHVLVDHEEYDGVLASRRRADVWW